MRKASLLAAVALMACGGGGGGGRGAEIVTCTPGNVITVGCGAEMLGMCTGDPVLDFCDGSMVAASACMSGAAGFIISEDDTMGLCPGLTLTCPASGMLAVRPRAFGTNPFTCDWATRSGDSPDSGM
jgi:hypothetical protein